MDQRLNTTASLSQLLSPLLSNQQTISEDKLTVAQVREEFKHIELTEQEEALALLDAYSRKVKAIQNEKDIAERNRRRDLIKQMWSYEECYRFALDRGHDIGIQRGFEFILDENNREVFKMLAEYFSNNPAFEKREYFGKKYSLKKGICLLSPVRGNGKTTLLDCFMYNKRGCFLKKGTKQLVKEYEKYGMDHVEKFMWLLPIASSAITFYQEHAGIHYDDFGDESEVMFMGNRRLLSSMIINSIYDDHRDDSMFHRFHISMNYKWSEFEAKYGSNSASRMEEMFNLIPVPGESRRK